MPQPITGLSDWKQVIGGYFSAFPDMQLEPQEEIAEGDRVAVRYFWTGTQRGVFIGIPPNGRPVRVTGSSTFRIAGAKSPRSGTWTKPGFAPATRGCARATSGHTCLNGAFLPRVGLRSPAWSGLAGQSGLWIGRLPLAGYRPGRLAGRLRSLVRPLVAISRDQLGQRLEVTELEWAGLDADPRVVRFWEHRYQLHERLK